MGGGGLELQLLLLLLFLLLLLWLGFRGQELYVPNWPGVVEEAAVLSNIVLVGNIPHKQAVVGVNDGQFGGGEESNANCSWGRGGGRRGGGRGGLGCGVNVRNCRREGEGSFVVEVRLPEQADNSVGTAGSDCGFVDGD